MELAYGVEDDVEDRIREFCADDSVVRGDELYIRRMAALMREHWDQQREYHAGLIGQGSRALKNRTEEQRRAAEEFRRLPVEEQIRVLEERNKESGGGSRGVILL